MFDLKKRKWSSSSSFSVVLRNVVPGKKVDFETASRLTITRNVSIFFFPYVISGLKREEKDGKQQQQRRESGSLSSWSPKKGKAAKVRGEKSSTLSFSTSAFPPHPHPGARIGIEEEEVDGEARTTIMGDTAEAEACSSNNAINPTDRKSSKVLKVRNTR